MFSPKTILKAALFTTLVSASAQFTGKALHVTDLSIKKVLGGNVTLAFTVYDPDPLTDATTTCTGTWETGSEGYPSGGYAACADDNFGWNFSAFESIKEFTLELEHSFEDPSIGDPPYDIVTTFSNANLTVANHPCKLQKFKTSCAQKSGSVIKAQIWGTEA